MLSDRIRRMFLSGACPENLYPKKSLSHKDQRFLQKEKWRPDKNLSRILIKQQKLLVEKHCGLKMEQYFNAIHASVVDNKEKKNMHSKAVYNQSNYPFPRKSKDLFVQSVKTKKKHLEKGGFDKNLLEKTKLASMPSSAGLRSEAWHAPFFLENNGKKLGVKSSIPRLFAPTFPVNPPFLQCKDHEKNTNCRYLFDHESLKACIVPQIFKNQKPVTRAKKLLHERKKIALLYGQLTKKEILNTSRKAVTLPGFFEDNMFTLLESRVDVCVFRAGFSKTIAGARQLIRNGSVLINGNKITSCKRTALPGDYFTFTLKKEILGPYRYTTLELYRLCLSSNSLRQWLFLNKKKFFMHKQQMALNQKPTLKQLEVKKNNKQQQETLTSPLLHAVQAMHWLRKQASKLCKGVDFLLNEFFIVPPKKNLKPAFCFSFYWGFFVYKLKKKEITHFAFSSEKKNKEKIKDLSRLRESFGKKKGLFSTLNLSFLDTARLFSVRFSAKKKGIALRPRSLKHSIDTHEFCRSITICNNLQQPVITNTKPLSRKGQGVPVSLVSSKKAFCPLSLHHKKNKKRILLNLYTQFLLKKKKQINLKKTKTKPFSNKNEKNEFLLYRKTIPLTVLWAIWGQKPLHLEISHKTGAFIYMYKPQKIISPVCLDFKL